MTLEVALTHAFPGFALDVAFAAPSGVTALFGRSGSGKTTIANAVAGLMRPDAGRIVLDGDTLTDTARGIGLPPHLRRIGYVFQDARLFPHMNVRQNLDYGRRMNRLPDDPAQNERVTDLLDIGHLLHRRPGKLSGGERQRVALGRALLAQPRLVLMDEPLAGVDAAILQARQEPRDAGAHARVARSDRNADDRQGANKRRGLIAWARRDPSQRITLTLRRVLGHEALTVCLLIANRVAHKANESYHDEMKKLISERTFYI